MKLLDNQGSKADWENDLVNDLSFIKEKKRYPLGKKTLKPAGLAAVFIALTGRVAMLLLVTKNSSKMSMWAEWLIGGLLAWLILLVFYQYYKMLKFDTIKTKYALTRNADLLKQFFAANNLAYTRHDNAPEVFMIISRNLNANPDKDYREVMVFIADDKQILVNSHFTGSKFSIAPPSRNFKKMSKELSGWIDRQIEHADSKDISIKTF